MSDSHYVSDRELMFQAAELNKLSDMEHLVNEKKVHIDIRDYNGRTPAHIAAMYGHVNIVKFVLEKEPSLLETADRSEETILMKAITYGHLNVVKYLIEKWKVDISQRWGNRHFGNTAIHFASKYGQLEILKYFIEEKNGNVNIENNFRETPLFLAAINKAYRIIQYLIEEKNADALRIDSKGHNILFKAVDNDDLGFIKYLLDLRQIPFDLNWRGFAGDTLVHHAVDQNRENVLLYLVKEKHADVNIADDLGETPLHKAAARNNYRVCRFLIDSGADTHVQNEKGQLPVQLAKDQRLIAYMKNYASEYRSRRSVTQPHLPYPSLPLLSAPFERISADSRITYVSAENRSKSSLSADTIDSIHLQSFLVVAKAIIGTSNSVLNQSSFLSPREIILNNIDPVAIDAVRRGPIFRRMNNHRL